MNPHVSVIIPNYNHGIYLEQRIDTVLRQTFRDFEVIILDDHSVDNSREVINNYRADPRVTNVILNDVNSGSPFRQWQRGISVARGEWIWIAESDDYAEERFLEKMITAAALHPAVGLVYCDSCFVGEAPPGHISFASIKNARFSTDRWAMDHNNRGICEIEDFLLPGGTINNTSAVLFNRKILVEANPFDKDLKYIGDKYAFIKVLSRSDVAYIKDKLNYYRNPFNTKHADRYVSYFYEQFLVFDWVLRNTGVNRAKFYAAFHANTRNSLFRGWNMMKLSLYRRLFSVNPSLLIRSVAHNLMQGLASITR